MIDGHELCLTGSSVSKVSSTSSVRRRPASARTPGRPGSGTTGGIQRHKDMPLSGGGDTARSSLSILSLPQSGEVVIGAGHRVATHGSKVAAFASNNSSTSSRSAASVNSARNRRPSGSGTSRSSALRQVTGIVSSMTDLRTAGTDVTTTAQPDPLTNKAVGSAGTASAMGITRPAWASSRTESGQQRTLTDSSNVDDLTDKSKTSLKSVPSHNGVDRSRRLHAAITIQRWYRKCLFRRRIRRPNGSDPPVPLNPPGHSARQSTSSVSSLSPSSAGQQSMKELLDSKRQEFMLRQQSGDAAIGGREDERQRHKEERARLARQEAIQELQKKREEKRQHDKQVSEQEISYLQATGKITTTKAGIGRKPSAGAGNTKAQRGTVARKSVSVDGKPETLQNGAPQSNGQVTDGNDTTTATDDDRPSITTDATTEQSTADQSTVTGGSTTKTTFDELMKALNQLEAEDQLPTPLTSHRQKSQQILNWLDDLEKEKDEPSNRESISSSRTTLPSAVRNDVTNYLDKVDVDSRLGDIDQNIERINAMLGKPALLVPSSDEMLEQASLAASEVTQQMLVQKMELEEKKRSVSMLQKALNQQRELTIRHAKETEKEMKKRLDVQKTEYEEAIKRHMGFIDQLIDDKKTLSEKCEQLVTELKNIDKKYQDKIKSLEDNHRVDMQKLHDLSTATEKVRREKWIEEKTKKIKEMTVKGLEPEIQRLIAQHKVELKKVKSIHEAELLASDERASQRYVRQIEELRDQLATEKESACARERQLAKESYEEQLRQREMLYQQQQQRLYQEVREEKERIAESARRQRAELDTLQRKLEDTHSNLMSSVRTEYEAAKKEQEQRHEAAIRQLKEQLVIEKEVWQENYRKKQETLLLQKERELQQQVKSARDQDIERVMQQLLKENQAAIDECEREADKRLKKIRDKLEKEKEDAERSERQITDKYTQIKARLSEVEGENECLKVALKQKERDIEEYRKILDKRNEERDHIADVIRQEFIDRIVATDEENKRLKNETAELKARHRVELERARGEVDVVIKAKEEEMEEVHKRVKQAIAKKEETLTQLREQYEKATKRADHLEDLLEQQRRQLLGKK